MNVAIFVHDLFGEIGHAHAMIELLNNLPNKKIKRLDIVAFTSSPPQELFKEICDHIVFHKVPFPKLYPFLFKMIFYHIYSFFIAKYKIPNDSIKIGIGIASLSARLINIQFVHTHWGKIFFATKKLSPLVYIYKKTLFTYFRLAEAYLYSRKDIQLFSLSNYVTQFLKENFPLKENQIKTIYSGINLTKFNLPNLERNEIFKNLCSNYPELTTINPLKPIALFVGAFERKGLQETLNSIKNIPDAQLIIIGSPESKSKINFPKNLTIVKIHFTTKLPMFYALADTFIFPTIYEPFGLVIIEAVAMGNQVYVTRENVGATEILEGLNEVHIIDRPKDLYIDSLTIIPMDKKRQLREERMERLQKYTWKKASTEFEKILNLVTK